MTSVTDSRAIRAGELTHAERTPGVNARNDLAAADWRFLLPRLHYRSLLHVGVPSGNIVPVLAGMAERAIIVSADGAALDRLRAGAAPALPGNVTLVCADLAREAPFADGTFELIVGSESRELSRVLRRTAVEHVERLLRSDGRLFIETAGYADAVRLRLRRAHAADRAPPTTLWLARRKGALRLALPLGRRDTERYCFNELVAGVSQRGRVLRQAARGLARLRLLRYAVPRRVLLLEQDRTRAQPPAAYVLAAAREAGLELPDDGLAFYARGDHNSNKVTFVLFNGAATPRAVVKMPRSPVYNARLEHEHHALTLLHQRGAAEPGTYPEPLFLGYHHGLAMIGQSALTGAAFRNATTGKVDCPHAARSIEWIVRLGEATTQPRTAPSALPTLFSQLCELYPLHDAEREFLGRHIEALERLSAGVPAVFQHGDAGTWNIVVEKDGRVAFLDWEYGDAEGYPLWDLFGFIQSYGGWAARLRGERDDASAFADTFSNHTPFARLQADAVGRYCARVGINRAAVEPLFYTCWMDRAVRSAPWTDGPLEKATFFRLLRQAISNRHAPGIACMFD